MHVINAILVSNAKRKLVIAPPKSATMFVDMIRHPHNPIDDLLQEGNGEIFSRKSNFEEKSQTSVSSAKNRVILQRIALINQRRIKWCIIFCCTLQELLMMTSNHYFPLKMNNP